MTRRALLVVDVQPAFVLEETHHVEKIKTLIGDFAAEHVYFAKYQNHPGSLFEKKIDYIDCVTSKDAKLYDLPAQRKDNIIVHFGYGLPREWQDHFAKNYDEVYVCGADTDACIMAICFNLWDNQVWPRIYKDHCWSSGGENLHQAALSMMVRQFGMDCILKEKSNRP